MTLLLASLASCVSGDAARPTAALARTSVESIAAETVIGIESELRSAIEDGGLVGVSVAVAAGGAPVYAQGFGHADAGRSIPATKDTAFDVASIGKHFTAVAILLLRDEGRLSIDQKARDWVPELPDHFPDATIEQLLRHTSGFVDGELDEQNPPPEYRKKRYGAELLSDVAIARGSAEFPPDRTWVYSNAGYVVLGIIVERASGARYDRFVRERLLDPLRLDGISVLERVSEPRMAQALRRTESGVAEMPYIDMTAYGGAGSICASVVDLMTWWRALNDGSLLSPESLATLRSASTVTGVADRAEVPYGMAQRLGRLGGHRKVGHTGTFDGGSAALYYYPDDDLAVAVLSNTRGLGTPHARSLEAEIALEILDTEPTETRRAPLSEEQKALIRGRYGHGGKKRFIAQFEGDELIVVIDDRPAERLVHVGGLEFRNPAKPLVHEYFLMDGARVGWWVYNESASYVEVLRRLD